MPKIKGLIFDFHGTLFYDTELHLRAFEECFPKYGTPALDRAFMLEAFFGRSNVDIFRGHYVPDASDEQLAEFEEYKEGLYQQLILSEPERYRLSDDVCEMLDFLKGSDIPYCIATGSPKTNVDFYLTALGLDRWFSYDNIIYSTGEFRGKPAPDIFLLAAERLGLAPDECAVFEDGTSGITAARAAKVGKVVAVWEEGYPSPLRGALTVDASYHDFKEWKNIFSTVLGLEI